MIAGEGELPFARLLDALRGLIPLDEVPGLCYRRGAGFVIREPFAHADMQPSPYSPAYLEALGGRIAYLETSRGCPYRCAFCLSGGEERLRTVPPERAYEEILLLANSVARMPDSSISHFVDLNAFLMFFLQKSIFVSPE